MMNKMMPLACSAGAVAMMLLSAPQAHAQVTVYGRLNVDAERLWLAGTPQADAFNGTQRVSANSSRFGLRAAREFNGLKLFGQIETGVSADTGGDTIASRDTYAGVEAGFGKLRIGKMDTPFKELGGLTDRFKGTGVQDDGGIAALGGSGNGFSRRQNNSLRYDSPALGPVVLQLQYGVDNEDAGVGDQRKVLTAGLEFKLDKLKAGAAFEQHRDFNPGNDTAWRVGANYDFGVLNLGVGFNRLGYKLATGSVARNYATVTAGVPVGQGVINLRVGKAGRVSGTAPVGTTVAGADGSALCLGPDSGASQFTAGYEHNVGPGAQFYAYWTRIVNQANANYRFGVNALNIAAANRGADASAVAAGLLFDF